MNPTPPDPLDVCKIDRMELQAALVELLLACWLVIRHVPFHRDTEDFREAMRHAQHTLDTYGFHKEVSVFEQAFPQATHERGEDTP